MVKFQTARQKARIVLNSDDAVKTLNEINLIPIVDTPIKFDGALGTNVDINTERIHFFDHGFSEGDAVTYTSTVVMTATPAITNNQGLYIKYVSENVFQLATTNGGAAINITATGTATQTLTKTLTFDGSLASVVSDTANTITLTGHKLSTGQVVRYDTTGTALTGLVSGRDYYVVKINDNTISLATTFQNATNINDDGAYYPIIIDINVGVGTTHNIKRIVSFDISASPVVDLPNDRLNIPAHNLSTGDMVIYQVDREGYGAGTAIGGLVDNMYYYAIVIDFDSIQLAETKALATAYPPTAVNFTAIGTGSNHSITRIVQSPVKVCTNYRFRLNNKPFDLNQNCRLAVQSFDYIKNYNTSKTKSIGGVYLKNLLPSNTYQSQGDGDGTILLPFNFANSASFQNNDVENFSIPLPSNINSILHNNLDIFVDTKKLNLNNQDINGCINDDPWCMQLVIYEYDELEVINKELDTKINNSLNPRLY
jgi:hypothetical protein